MALIECPECKEQVSKSAENCPKCGCPVKKKSRPLLVGCGTLIAIVVMIGVIGECQQASDRAAAKKNGGNTAEIASAQKTLSEVSPNLGAASTPAVAPAAALPAISPVQWGEIDRVYNLKSNVTELQKNEIWKQYKGKRVRWTGRVSSIGETFGKMSMQVKMNANSFVGDAIVYLPDSEKQKALKLMVGNVVQFTGTLQEWGSLLPVSLSDGVIESAQ